ncbi:host cell factor 2-like [Daktulosphaira vitifoliae]|uniref:host cell factor 2-like n=1 Tax=Daktulosphaira vitifoliae TaxID=58002 RepID=UPI0021AABB0E|nr:host cell factor 2-like [Daktulosphaira vitifoliae]XP_050538618.1 host cell factor 2-like [Daktulosphaira vitifoliae]
MNMNDKDTVDDAAIIAPESENDNEPQQLTEDLKDLPDTEPILQHHNNELEAMSVDETEESNGLKLAHEKIHDESEKAEEKMETNELPMAVDVAQPQDSEPVSTFDSALTHDGNNSLESIKSDITSNQNNEALNENIIEGNHQQSMPSDSSVSTNNEIKLDNTGVDIDQQSVLSMKDSELKDLVMRELSEFLTDEPSQNGGSIPDIKSEDSKIEDQKNIEHLENSLSEVIKIESKEEKKSENDIADALSTLATAALNQGSTNGSNDVVMSKPTMAVLPVKQDGPAWCDVGVIKGTTCLVKQFYSTTTTDEHESTSLDHLPDYTNKLKIDIQPGTAYKLRIAAINACGRGEWSEISAFKTCLPGYPGAPSAIKITKAPDGASLTWEAPPSSSGKILEYSVCLAIKSPKDIPQQSPKAVTTSLNFVRVYCGPQNAAVVSHESLGAALIDRTNKPAIIFRIAAKNEKGYGPATQVRWLQDSNIPGSNKIPSMKREKSVNLLTGVPKRPKL